MRQSRGSALVALALAVTVCCCASVASAQAPAPSADRLFCKRLDAERDVRFAWSFNDTHVLVSVSALTDGWLAMGWSSDGTMDSSGAGTDVGLGWIDGGGVPSLYDYEAVAHSKPVLDASQDLSLEHAVRADGYLLLEWSRPITTGDADGDVDLDGVGDIWINWGLSDTLPLAPDSFVRHAERGTSHVHLYTDSSCDAPAVTVNPREGNTVTGPNTGVTLEWLADTPTFEISMRTATPEDGGDGFGWLGFGISETPSMLNSDMVIAWLSEDDGGNVGGNVIDAWVGAERSRPTADTDLGGEASWEVISAVSADGTSAITLRRAQYNDDLLDADIETRSYYVLLARGSDTPSADGSYSKHDSVDIVSIDFFAGDVVMEVEAETRSARTTPFTIHAVVMLGVWMAAGAVVAWRFGLSHGREAGTVTVIVVTAVVLVSAAVGLLVPAFQGLNVMSSAHGSAGVLLVSLWVLAFGSILAMIDPVAISSTRLAVAVGFLVAVSILGDVIAVTGLVRYDADAVVAVLYFVVRVATLVVLAVGYWQQGRGTAVSAADAKPAPEVPMLTTNGKGGKGKGKGRAGKSSTSASTSAVSSSMGESASRSVSRSDLGASQKLVGVNGNAPSRSQAESLGRFASRGAVLVVVVLAAVALLDLAATRNDPMVDGSLQHCRDCLSATYLFEDFHVPANETSYMCRKFKVELDVQHHAVSFNPIIDAAETVHHLVLYSLPYDYAEEYWECSSMPDSALPVYAWAGSDGALTLPGGVGMRAGPDTNINYLVLQVHYDNPTRAADIVDSSGLRIDYTPHLKEQDAGLLFIGPDFFDDSFSIPPGEEFYRISGTCGAADTGQMPRPLHVFAIAQHAHAIGRWLWAEQYRDGEFVGLFATENAAYDFNVQGFEETHLTIYPGDEIVVHCVYDSRTRDYTTVGGDSTRQEMCIMIVMYTAATDAAFCGSLPQYPGETPYNPPAGVPDL